MYNISRSQNNFKSNVLKYTFKYIIIWNSQDNASNIEITQTKPLLTCYEKLVSVHIKSIVVASQSYLSLRNATFCQNYD